MIGEKYGRWTVAQMLNTKQNVICICECGTTRSVDRLNLIKGKTLSCGCLRSEVCREKGKQSKTHGMEGTRIYNIWAHIKNRCNSTNHHAYHRYGGRGISVCEEWSKFEPFYKWAIENGYSDTLSIDRINNDLNYNPDNCRWVTQKEQANNVSSNKRIEYNGETKTMKQWSEQLGINYITLTSRLKTWSVEKAFTTPVNRNLKRW